MKDISKCQWFHMGQEYMVQYCEWDERWYAWGTEWNLNLSEETKEGAIKRFESAIHLIEWAYERVESSPFPGADGAETAGWVD